MEYDLLVVNGGIDQSVIKKVLKEVDETQAAKRLIVILNTLGGSPYVAYRAMTHLQYMYPAPAKIEVLVPDLAMSAGTLMCLGGDQIYMHEGSCLGPLDLQVEHPSDGGMISSLDIQEAMYQVFGLTNLVAGQFYRKSRNEFKLPKSEAATIAYDSAVKLFTPLVDKVDPFHLQESYRAGPVSEHYASLLMVRSVRGDQKRRHIAKRLTKEYQTHGYAITKDEVQYLGLNVEKLTALDIYNDVMSRYDESVEEVKYERIRIPTKSKKEKATNDSKK